MKRRFKVCAGPQRKSADEMLQAFEGKLNELDISSGCHVEGAINSEREVYIDDLDYNEYYTDTHGEFGEPGGVVSCGELKNYWNQNNEVDPLLASYLDFEDWWADTLDYLEEIPT